LPSAPFISAVYCSVLQRISEVYCSMLQCMYAVYSSVLQCAVRCSVLQCVAAQAYLRHQHPAFLQCVAVCCSVLPRVVVCCSVLQCAAVCCSVLQCRHMFEISTPNFCNLCQYVAEYCTVLQQYRYVIRWQYPISIGAM